MNDADAQLLAAAEAWAAQDPDDVTRAELVALVDAVRSGDAEARAELHDRFDGRLTFGTAGLRGRLEAGPNRMNRVTVAQAARGLATYLTARGEEPSIVIGYDGRTNSEQFAYDSARILAGAGVHTVVLPRLLPTPVLAFAVRRLNVSAGVMVTASHNPPRDNGYKVYLGDDDHGSQIVPPADAAIADAIDAAATNPIADYPRSEAFTVADDSVVDAYVAATARVAALPPAVDGSALTIVYTPMHGVGHETAMRVFDAAGVPRPHVVAAQRDPDASFRTVSFPNPEEPGALDLALELAREVSADLVLANDPDADRFAVAVPDASAEAGYRRLTGNEVGLLLGEDAAASAREHGRVGTLAASLVSSPGLRAIAAHHGLDYAETLTGFKWISRAEGLVYGYEEALGYLVNPETVRDKDGISAALAFVGLAHRLAASARTIGDQLDALAERYGLYASDQVSIRVTDLTRLAEMMSGLRAAPPRDFAGVAVTRADDLLHDDGQTPPSDVLRYGLDDGSRVVVRPSGTEPKLKVYLDVHIASHGHAAVQDAEERLTRLAAAARELLA